MWVFVRPDRCVDWHSSFQRRHLIRMKVSRRGDACGKADSQFTGYPRHRTNPPKCKPHSWINRPRRCPRHMRISAHSIDICPHRDLQTISLYHFTTRKPISRRRLIEEEPWYLPAGPFKLNSTTTNCKGMHGREEIEWWEAQWAAGGISPEELDDRIPWFLYRKECSKNMSMWNRKRIWGIAKQLCALARAKGLL